MFFQRIRPLAESTVLEDIRADFRESRRLEKYRLGRKALYFPAGFVWEYLPLADIEKIRRVTRLIESENGVCPFSMEVPSVRLFFHGKELVLEIEKEKSVAAVIHAMNGTAPR